MPLTDVALRTAKPKPKSYRMSDAAGLYIEMAERLETRRLKYRLDGKEKRLALGNYPTVSFEPPSFAPPMA